MKPVIIILTIVSLGLGLALLVQHKQTEQQLKAAEVESLRLTSDRETLRVKLDDSEKVATRLESDLNQRSKELTGTANDLAKANSDLARSQTEYKSALAEVQKQSTRIGELENQRDDLSKRMEDLTGSIGTLENQIADTRKKLATSEGDRQFLLAQLKQLENEKAQLVAQFNNLSVLRTQIAKLKEEAAITQRLAWIRTGVYRSQEMKGAEKLLAGSAKKEKTEGRVLIELDQKGNSKIVVPAPSTSAPVN